MEIVIGTILLLVLFVFRKTIYVYANLAEEASTEKADDIKVTIANGAITTAERKIMLGKRIATLSVDHSAYSTAEAFIHNRTLPEPVQQPRTTQTTGGNQ